MAKSEAVEESRVEHYIADADRDANSQFILQRHGTLSLDPLPSSSPQDPLNWPTWKKNTQLLLVAFHAMIAIFQAAGVNPGFETFSNRYGVTIQQASYLLSSQVLFLGVAPIVWNPIAKRYGRRLVFLISVLGSGVCNIGGAVCTSYGSQMATRILTSIFISPPLGSGVGVVTDLFFAHERAQKVGWWTLLTTLGAAGGPFVMGFVVQHLGVNWIFWISSCINFVQFLAYLLLYTETFYDRSRTSGIPKPGLFNFPRLDKTPLVWSDFIAPFYLCRHVRVVLPACVYALQYCYSNLSIITEIPGVLGNLFNLDAQEVGLQYLAVIIGTILGEQLSGPLSDAFLNQYVRKKGYGSPARRLWVAYCGFLAVIAGLLVWGFQIQHAHKDDWNITPLVGAAIANFGNQVITTTLITFAVDHYRESSTEIGVLVTFARQTWGFIGPFYYTPLFDALGAALANGIFCIIIFVCGFVPVAALHFHDRHRRSRAEVDHGSGGPEQCNQAPP
ncbi:putative MFS transporter [Trichoderma evansii]